MFGKSALYIQLLKNNKIYFVKTLTYDANNHIILNYIKYTKYKKTIEQKDVEDKSKLNLKSSEPVTV